MPDDRAPKINSHVSRLNRFLPFSAAHDQIYEEYQTGEDSLDLQTVALSYAERALRAGAKCIVLTGDAGHGKTHMCRRLIENLLGYAGGDARRLLVSKCNGSTAIDSLDSATPLRLRIHKDFSELDLLSAAALLESIPSQPDEALVVCANEGRLRAVVSSAGAGDVCRTIRDLFQQSFTTGLSSLDGNIHIINLNYQSVAAKAEATQGSLTRRVIKSWAGDGRRWAGCESCSLSRDCPIRQNRKLLIEDGGTSERRISRLEELCEAVERLGHVITIREMLMLISYLITGGMTCEDVQRKSTKAHHKTGWQHSWAFYNLLFQSAPETSEDRIHTGIPVLSIFRRLDPGAIASRAVDEKILNIGSVFPEEELDLQFLSGASGKARLVDAALGIDDFMGNPQNKAELARETEVATTAVRALRRRAFFDDEESQGSLMSRLGFRHGDSFLGMLEGRLSPPDQVKLKSTITTGLHAIQGLRMSRTETTLHLVDPAFGRASADTAIIARRIPISRLQMLPARKAWQTHEGNWKLNDSVDWIDRTVVVRVQESGEQYTDIALDLLSFECVARSAAGYVPEDFYSHEIRRVRAFLGRLAARGRNDGEEIALFMKGRVQNVSIDMGVIQVGGV
ncbi:hypothetical protein D3C78_401320 [compost metagenome]